MITTRKQRRAYLAWLKKNDPKAYKQAKAQVQKIGQDLHRRHVAEQMNKMEEERIKLELKIAQRKLNQETSNLDDK